MKKSILLTCVLLSSITASETMNTNIVPLSGVAGSNGMVFPKSMSRVVIKNVNANKDNAYDSNTKLDDPLNRTMKVNMTQFLYRQGLGKGFDIRLILPYVKKESSLKHPMQGSFKNENSGLGDIKLISRYQILNQKKGDLFFLAIGLGVKLPTGDTNKSFKMPVPSGKQIVPTMQLGSGSTDFITELGLSKLLPNSRIDAHILYQMNTEGDNNYEFGDKLVWNIGYSYALNKNFDLGLTLHGMKMKKHKSNGVSVDYSGGNFTYISPSIHYKINKKFDVCLAYSRMIDRDNNYDSSKKLGGLSEDSKFLIRLGYNF